MNIDKWDKRFLELAETVAKWSKDPSTKVGSVLTDGNRIVSLGYNGFAAGVIIQCGIKRIVSISPSDDQMQRWGESFKISETMYREAGVKRRLYEG